MFIYNVILKEAEKIGQKEYFEKLDKLINSFGKKCVAIGECGLGIFSRKKMN